MKANLTLPAGICRWTGRILGTLLAILLGCLAVGEGVPNVFTQPAVVQIGFLALGLVLAGILGGWRWELAGGIISLVGWGAFVAVEVGSLARLNLFLALLALPGAFYIASALLRRVRL
jgi:hypothetical protein